MKNLFNEDINEPFVMADRLLKGYNKNEVMFTQKTIKNKGFFEKFFHFLVRLYFLVIFVVFDI